MIDTTAPWVVRLHILNAAADYLLPVLQCLLRFFPDIHRGGLHLRWTRYLGNEQHCVLYAVDFLLRVRWDRGVTTAITDYVAEINAMPTLADRHKRVVETWNELVRGG